MDKKEKHVRENKGANYETPDQIANSMKARGKERQRENTSRINKFWLWFGVLVLVFILLYWLFSIGIFGDLTNSFNG
ncbi:MAG: hypothetical protein K2N03_02810 [Muribaculaceae bacterium]|nr:hypothetical protein [Muribaculaceae bacterium]